MRRKVHSITTSSYLPMLIPEILAKKMEEHDLDPEKLLMNGRRRSSVHNIRRTPYEEACTLRVAGRRHPDTRLVFIRKGSPLSLATKSLVGIFDQRLKRVASPILSFDSTFDLILYGNDAWIFNQANFEGLFKESAAVLAKTAHATCFLRSTMITKRLPGCRRRARGRRRSRGRSGTGRARTASCSWSGSCPAMTRRESGVVDRRGLRVGRAGHCQAVTAGVACADSSAGPAGAVLTPACRCTPDPVPPLFPHSRPARVGISLMPVGVGTVASVRQHLQMHICR